MAFTLSVPTAILASTVARARNPRTTCALPKPLLRTSLPALPAALASRQEKSCTSQAMSSTRQRTLVCTAAVSDVETTNQPTVMIDNLSDPMATIVVIEFGDYLGDMLDTMAALRNLGLNINKASLTADNSKAKRFFVTDAKTSEKVFLSSRLEEVKVTILNTMMEFHPEAIPILSSAKSPKKERNPLEPREEPSIPTSIKIWADEAAGRSRLDVVTTDRNGLLVDIVRILKDISVNVLSAEIDTIGIMAHDIFFLTYKGDALNPPMEELVKNALYYYLVLSEVETTESY